MTKHTMLLPRRIFSVESEAFVEQVFYNKAVRKNFSKLTGKHLCQSLVFSKVTGYRSFPNFPAPLCCATVEHLQAFDSVQY